MASVKKLAIICTLIFSISNISAVESWQLDKKVSYIKFHIDSMLSGVDGEFRDFTVTSIDDNKSGLKGVLQIKTNSITTKNAKRDKHLRSEDFFFSKKYPLATVEVISVENEKAKVKITIRGKSQIKLIPLTIKKTINTIEASGHLMLNRKKFDINYGAFYNPIKDNAMVRFRIHLKKR